MEEEKVKKIIDLINKKAQRDEEFANQISSSIKELLAYIDEIEKNLLDRN